MKGSGTMKINIFGKNIEVTDGIKSAVQEKLGKLDKYFAEETRADVTLSVNRNDQKVEVTIPVKGNIIRAEEVSEDMYASIDMVEETIEEAAVKIVRTKSFGIKPMDPEEACVQMELLGHNFFVFLNADTDEVNVVYKRKGNTYGLIEPMFD